MRLTKRIFRMISQVSTISEFMKLRLENCYFSTVCMFVLHRVIYFNWSKISHCQKFSSNLFSNLIAPIWFQFSLSTVNVSPLYSVTKTPHFSLKNTPYSTETKSKKRTTKGNTSTDQPWTLHFETTKSEQCNK